MFNSLKIPGAFFITGICWAIFSGPTINLLTKQGIIQDQEFAGYLNNIVFVVCITVILYIEINRKQRALLRSEVEYRHLFESNPNPMWIYDNKSYRFIKVNNSAIEKYGYSPEQFSKMTIHDIRPPEEQESFRNDLKNDSGQLRKAGVWKHQKRSGEVFSVSIISHPVLFQKKQCKMIMITDITDILEKEIKLKDAYEKIQSFNQTLLHLAWSNSHEVRKPLCSILGLITILKEAEDPDEIRGLLVLLNNCAQELEQITKANNEQVSNIDFGTVVV